MNPISELLSVSPFRYLHHQASETRACLGQLQLQFEAALSNDGEAVLRHLREIESHVLLGRMTADEGYQLLSQPAMLPVCRGEIISTFITLNLMLCTCHDVASLISARSISLTDDARQQLSACVREMLGLSTVGTDIITKVNVLVEVCFEGPEADEVRSLIDDMQLRSTTTNLRRNRLLQSLFSNDGDTRPPEQILCLSLITEMGRILGFAEQLTSRFRLFIHQQSSSRETGLIASGLSWIRDSVSRDVDVTSVSNCSSTDGAQPGRASDRPEPSGFRPIEPPTRRRRGAC